MTTRARVSASALSHARSPHHPLPFALLDDDRGDPTPSSSSSEDSTYRIYNWFILTLIMADQPKPKPVLSLTSEPKARGANRSTKVAGKLKVLPDQPELDAPSGPISSTSGGFQPPPPPRREQQPAQEQQSTESSDEDEPESEQDVQEEEVHISCL
jgi:hypothetical protein